MPDRNDDRGTPEARKDHLFMFGELTPERAQEISERLLADWDREYTLFINSDGGSSFDALALVNLLKMVAKTLLLAALLFVVIRGFLGAALKLGYVYPGTIMAAGTRAPTSAVRPRSPHPPLPIPCMSPRSRPSFRSK